jgi:hypothetical protein
MNINESMISIGKMKHLQNEVDILLDEDDR